MTNEIKRSFIPGSEWLYYKLYCGNHTSDIILTEVVFPFVRKLQKGNLIKSWFFIRYNDPDNHLRIRFLLDEAKNFNDILGWFRECLEPYVKTKMIWKIQLDTYQREVERYGENTMEISEALFNNDSEEVLNFLTENDFTDEKVKYFFAIKHMYKIISCFISDIDEQFLYVKESRNRYKNELKIDKKIIRQLDQKYRTFKQYYVDEVQNEDNFSTKFTDSLDLICNKISKIEYRGDLQVVYNELVWSYIHMSINRIFNEQQRLKEFVCYEFLYKDLKTLKFNIKE